MKQALKPLGVSPAVSRGMQRRGGRYRFDHGDRRTLNLGPTDRRKDGNSSAHDCRLETLLPHEQESNGGNRFRPAIRAR